MRLLNLLLISLISFSPQVTYAQCYFTGTGISKCCGATVIGECPVEGCKGDTLLNLRKNITAKPTNAEIQDWEFEKILFVTFPASWARGTNRQQLTDWGEGTPIRIKTHIKEVKNYSSTL